MVSAINLKSSGSVSDEMVVNAWFWGWFTVVSQVSGGVVSVVSQVAVGVVSAGISVVVGLFVVVVLPLNVDIGTGSGLALVLSCTNLYFFSGDLSVFMVM